MYNLRYWRNTLKYTIEEIIEKIKKEGFNIEVNFSLLKSYKNSENLIRLLDLMNDHENYNKKLFLSLLDNGIFNFFDNEKENICFLINNIFESRNTFLFYNLFMSEKHKHLTFYEKEIRHNLEEIIDSSIRSENIEISNKIFFEFFHEDYFIFTDINSLISEAASHKKIKIFDFLFDIAELDDVDFIKNSRILNHNAPIYFIEKIFNKYDFNKKQIFDLLHSSFYNKEIFNFLFNKIKNDLDNFNYALLLEKAVRNTSINIIEILLENINFNLKDFHFNYLNDFFNSYDNTGNVIDVFFDEDNSMESHIKINLFSILVKNKNIFDFNNDIDWLMKQILNNFDYDLLCYMIENYDLKDYIKNNQKNINEWFLKGISEKNMFFYFTNIEYSVKNLNIDLSFNNNFYVYKIIFERLSQVGSNNEYINKVEDSKLNKVLLYLLSNKSVSQTFDISIINRYKHKLTEHVVSTIKKNISINNF